MTQAASDLVFLVINGLIWGLIVALIAIGLTLIFGVMGIVNMAHGDLYMVGAVVSYYVSKFLGNFWLSLLLGPLLALGLAVPLERVIVRPYAGNPSGSMIATVGLSFIIQQLALAIYGGVPNKIPDPMEASILLFGLSYPTYRIFVAMVSLTILGALWLFLYRTSLGILIRATMQDREMASAMGINTGRILIITFAIGTVLAVLGGVLAAPIRQVFYLMGNDVVLLCFIVVIIGGLGSLRGTFITSLLLCSLEGLLSGFLPPVLARAVTFGLMVVILLWKPRGIYGD
ncbi:MAG: branched-chain amino acid ABC transporter permease [Candidatus Hadarchaeum sp.]|uniref:branched-chain amino acid ABC transporter permease n=1 Tax=Candidatus Hadarchaeum sp. TaxID=2883567 RepID=UPI00316F52FD